MNKFKTSDVDWPVFGLFIRARVILRETNINDVSHIVDLAPTTIRRAMSGKPTTKTSFKKLCDWLGDQPEIFIGGGHAA